MVGEQAHLCEAEADDARDDDEERSDAEEPQQQRESLRAALRHAVSCGFAGGARAGGTHRRGGVRGWVLARWRACERPLVILADSVLPGVS